MKKDIHIPLALLYRLFGKILPKVNKTKQCLKTVQETRSRQQKR